MMGKEEEPEMRDSWRARLRQVDRLIRDGGGGDGKSGRQRDKEPAGREGERKDRDCK